MCDDLGERTPIKPIYFSSSSRPLGVKMEVRNIPPLNRKGAQELVERLRSKRDLGILMATTVLNPGKGRVGHLVSLIFEEGAIIEIDARRPRITRCVSPRKALICLRRAQKKGLVIEVRQSSINPSTSLI